MDYDVSKKSTWTTLGRCHAGAARSRSEPSLIQKPSVAVREPPIPTQRPAEVSSKVLEEAVPDGSPQSQDRVQKPFHSPIMQNEKSVSCFPRLSMFFCRGVFGV